jgi:predicted RNA-binding protein with EMAP domain
MSTVSETNLNGLLTDITTSYESRIQKIQTAFKSSENVTESSHLLFDNVQKFLNNLKKEREILNSRLSETMAKNGSLRKKDYNLLMTDVLELLDKKELETEKQFLNFIKDQKDTTQSLKNSLLDIKDINSQETSEKITIIKDQLSQISKLQGMRKEAVIKSFTDFQQMHNRIMEYLGNLLKNGDKVQIKDIKLIKNQIIREIN